MRNKVSECQFSGCSVDHSLPRSEAALQVLQDRFHNLAGIQTHSHTVTACNRIVIPNGTAIQQRLSLLWRAIPDAGAIMVFQQPIDDCCAHQSQPDHNDSRLRFNRLHQQLVSRKKAHTVHLRRVGLNVKS